MFSLARKSAQPSVQSVVFVKAPTWLTDWKKPPAKRVLLKEAPEAKVAVAEVSAKFGFLG